MALVTTPRRIRSPATGRRSRRGWSAPRPPRAGSDCGLSSRGCCLRKARIRSPSHDRGGCTHRRNSQVRKSAGVVLEGEGRQRRRVIRMEGAYLLPTIRRSQSINGLLYARERDASEWTDSGMEAVERGDSNVRRDEEEIDPNRSCMDAGQEGMKIGRERA